MKSHAVAMIATHPPTLMERERGGWLALSPDDAALRIAVLGATAQEAEDEYSVAVEAWKRLLALASERDNLDP